MATVTHLSGLHDHGLEAFRTACSIVDANIRRAPLFDPRAENLMKQVRALLTYAHQCEVAGEIEIADSFGARSANRLAAAIRLGEHA